MHINNINMCLCTILLFNVFRRIGDLPTRWVMCPADPWQSTSSLSRGWLLYSLSNKHKMCITYFITFSTKTDTRQWRQDQWNEWFSFVQIACVWTSSCQVKLVLVTWWSMAAMCHLFSHGRPPSPLCLTLLDDLRLFRALPSPYKVPYNHWGIHIPIFLV